jgi:23S rRNA pseudouridine1911/1915/1917 synthase
MNTQHPMLKKNISASAIDQGKRMDVWLHEQMPEFSRSRIKALIKSGEITVDGMRLTAHKHVATGMEVEVNLHEVVDVGVIAEDIPLDILFEDHDFIVINKKAGMVVHPAPGHSSGTLVNALLFHCHDLRGVGGELRPGIVHRLDKDTSGAIIVAKHEQAMEHLCAQFKNREIKKQYLTIVYGVPELSKGTIETMIGRSNHDRKKMSVLSTVGREAVSHYELLEDFGKCSFLRVQIETGRTHQIRVHMAHIGHPVLGDDVYCSKKRKREWEDTVSRQMLHAAYIRFKHPASGEFMEIEAPLPDDMQELLGKLRGG